MAENINLATKYSNDICEKFAMESFIGKDFSNKFNFVGAKTIEIYTPQTVGLNNYDRDGVNGSFTRFGSYTEVEDEIQELTLTQDKSFALTLDRANAEERNQAVNGMQILGLQIKEQVTPEMDRYTFEKWLGSSLIAQDNKKSLSSLTKSNIVSEIIEGGAKLDNKLVPRDNRTVYVPTSHIPKLLLADEVVKLDGLGTKAVEKGTVGSIMGMKIKSVPDVLMPNNVGFAIVYKNSVLRPLKIRTARVLSNVVGIDGSVIEGRFYYDAFVLKAKADGIYVASIS